MTNVAEFFDRSGLTPHGFCLSWDANLIALHVVSDALIGLSYFSIPLALGWFVLQRRDLAFPWVFWLFAVFILACGTTHFLSIWTLWKPDYATEGVIKAFTAVVSVMTAIQLWPLLPRAVALPSPAMLRAANEELEVRIAERDDVVRALQRETAERVRTEAMFAQAQKMEAVGQLTGGMAHDFNNLLMIVTANLEMLAKRIGEESPMRRYVDRAMTGAVRGATLIQQLLAFARRQSLKPVRFVPSALVADMAPLVAGVVGAHAVLETETAGSNWTVEADPHQLESALLNLVINARHAMPGGGTILLRMEDVTVADDDAGEITPGDYVLISVADTGVGMSEEVRARAFDPFFTTKPVGQGSGLGLSQVYGFVKQSSGHVVLASAPGQGTTVRIYMPRSVAAPVAAAISAQNGAARAVFARGGLGSPDPDALASG